MTTGVRATVEFDSPGVCPLAALSTETNTRISGITNSIGDKSNTPSVSEFTLDKPGKIPDHFEQIYSHSQGYRYRFPHGDDVTCPCEILGANGSAPAYYVANDGYLTIVFYAMDYEQLQLIIGALKDNFESLDIKQLIQASPNATESSEVLVDVGTLTDRQFNVLQTAYEMGYFNRPRDANAEEVAAALNIHPSTLNEHLAKSQTKLFKNIFRNQPSNRPGDDSGSE